MEREGAWVRCLVKLNLSILHRRHRPRVVTHIRDARTGILLRSISLKLTPIWTQLNCV